MEQPGRRIKTAMDPIVPWRLLAAAVVAVVDGSLNKVRNRTGGKVRNSVVDSVYFVSAIVVVGDLLLLKVVVVGADDETDDTEEEEDDSEETERGRRFPTRISFWNDLLGGDNLYDDGGGGGGLDGGCGGGSGISGSGCSCMIVSVGDDVGGRGGTVSTSVAVAVAVVVGAMGASGTTSFC